MGDAPTTKQIANKIKAKGLQKLKFYCQMCEKQCRDEAGFKNHCLSESHQRQMSLFAQNSHKFTATFSKEFKQGFVDILRTRHPNSKVLANRVYNEYIADRNHVHMNSTQWTTLSGFVKSLAEEGIARAEETERGWVIQYIHRDPEIVKMQLEAAKKRDEDKDDEQRKLELIEKQIAAAKKLEEEKQAKPLETTEERKEYDPNSSTTPISFSFAKTNVSKPLSTPSILLKPTKRKELDIKSETVDEQQATKKQKLDKEEATTTWLLPNIIVKVIHETLSNGDYFKKKGKIIQVLDKGVAQIEMVDNGDVLQLHQKYLETVIPKENSQVYIVSGEYRGKLATLQSVDREKGCATLLLQHSSSTVTLSFDDFSKST